MISFTHSALEWTLRTGNLTRINQLNFLLINTVTRILASRLINRLYLRGVKSRLMIYYSFIQKPPVFDFTTASIRIFCRGLSHLQIPFQNTMFWSAILRII
jgi:hypothetical protein